LLFSRIISTFKPQKKSILKTGPQIKISNSFFEKSLWITGFGSSKDLKELTKKYNNFGGLTIWHQLHNTDSQQ
jgi:hypothetical protein